MNHDENDGSKSVSMLLDIDNFYGESEGRVGPTIKMLCLGLAPVLLWVYLGFIIPPVIFFPLEVIWFARVAMLTVGREKERLAQYRKQLHDDYASIYELLNIRTIHPDGCVEYVNGTVGYCLICANGSTYDELSHTYTVRDFLSMLGKFDIDIYCQNITDMKSLEDRYNNVKLFADAEAAKDFIDIIDHNRTVVYSESLLTRVVIMVKGHRSYFSEIRDCCKAAVYSTAARAFKDVHIATPAEIQEVLNTDIRGLVDLDNLLQRKYATHQYYGSRVLYFDDEPEAQVEDTNVEERGFLVKDE